MKILLLFLIIIDVYNIANSHSGHKHSVMSFQSLQASVFQLLEKQGVRKRKFCFIKKLKSASTVVCFSAIQPHRATSISDFYQIMPQHMNRAVQTADFSVTGS